MTTSTKNEVKVGLHQQLLIDLAEILNVRIADLPKVFQSKVKRVLKIGIFNDLAEAYPDANKEDLALWFVKWTRTGGYLRQIIKGTNRHDLNGIDCGLIEQKSRDYAQGILKSREKRKRVSQ